jgi:hypothetical protein
MGGGGMGGGGYRGIGGGRGGGGRGRGGFGFNPQTQQSEDPRSIREYVDLDAPTDAPMEIDYRTQVSYDDV